MNFAHKIRRALQLDTFSYTDLKAVLYPASSASIHNGISRSVKSKEIIQLKRGLYLFSKELRKGPLSKFSLANKLYVPSYISFESALSIHQLIPEGVYTTTSTCPQRKSKTFENEIGTFTYQYIPCSNFFLDVFLDQENGGAMTARPLRALYDFIYFRKKKYQSINELELDLRLELENVSSFLKEYSVKDMESLARQYKKRNVLEFYKLLIRGFK